MRITTNMMSNKYVKDLNKSAEKMNYTSNQVTTGKKFFKGSEDPVSAIKAYKLRREYRETEIHITALRDADSYLTMAETSLTEISNNLERVYTSYLKGINGSMTKEDRGIIVEELENLQDFILSSLNSKFSDKYLFGGTSKEEIPFTVDPVTGDLVYKGVNVNTGLDKDGNAVDMDELTKEAAYVDIGLGDITKPDGSINKANLFNLSMSGISVMGYGTDGNGVYNNLYSVINEIKRELKSDDFSMENIQPHLNKFDNQKIKVLISITGIGAKANYVEFLKSKNEDTTMDLNETLVDVEGVDIAEAATDFAMQKYQYDAALSMGNQILQKSFIDYMK